MKRTFWARRDLVGALCLFLLLVGAWMGRLQPASAVTRAAAAPAGRGLTISVTPTLDLVPAAAPTHSESKDSRAASTRVITATPLPATSLLSKPPAPGGQPTSTARAAAPQYTPHDPAHPLTLRDRVGVALPNGSIDDYDWGAVRPGWYLSWWVQPQPVRAGGLQFAQMVRLSGDGFKPDLAVITQVAQQNPGALWLVGNEPDVPLQDNVTPLQYVRSYRVVYAAIKAADAQSQIAIAGAGQPTPLRMIYLDRVLSTYRSLYGEEMPVDVWNIHAFVLREERGAWGVGIPPGIDLDRGRLYEVADHDNLGIFQQQILDFRRWMAQRGLRDKPLIVTEYGILMPAEYGFDAERVKRFLRGSFNFYLSARDPELGYPGDDNRLVQAFCWFSVADRLYPAGNLFDPQTLAISPVGEAFKQYLANLVAPPLQVGRMGPDQHGGPIE